MTGAGGGRGQLSLRAEFLRSGAAAIAPADQVARNPVPRLDYVGVCVDVDVESGGNLIQCFWMM